MSLESRTRAAEGASGRLGIVLYTGPASSLFALGIELAKAALSKGHDVVIFAWGDAVYGTARLSQDGTSSSDGASSRVADLLQAHSGRKPELVLNVCTSCYKTRGLSQKHALPGVRLGGLHNIVEMFRTCGRTVMLVP